MSQQVRKFTIIGEDEQAAGIVIEPPDGKYPGINVIDDISNRFSSPWIGHCREYASGFIQQDIYFFVYKGYQPAVKANPLFFGVNKGTRHKYYSFV